MSETYLITGGAGFIGSHLVQRILHEGGRVRVVDNLATGKLERLEKVRSSIEFVRGDLADSTLCDEVVSGVDYVLHQAAVPSVQRSIQDPICTHRANVTGTLNLLESCRKERVRRLIYAASSSAYGDTEVLPKTETMPANPLSPYALQKLTGEVYCKLYFDIFGLETVSLRYFNVFGPNQDPHSEYSAVIPKFAARLINGKSVVVFGDGEQSRDFTFIDNVVEANLLAVRAVEAPGKILNIGYGERTTLNRLIQTLERILNVKARIDYQPSRAGDVRHSLADIGIARRVLGYNPKVDVEDGLKRTVEALKNSGGKAR